MNRRIEYRDWLVKMLLPCFLLLIVKVILDCSYWINCCNNHDDYVLSIVGLYVENTYILMTR